MKKAMTFVAIAALTSGLVLSVGCAKPADADAEAQVAEETTDATAAEGTAAETATDAAKSE